ncbi:MAG: CmcJ/NvfI family oxidoreductase [Caulobacteraceae bacterium]
MADQTILERPRADASVEASVNYVGPMSERPKFHAQDHSRDNLNLEPHVAPIHDARAMADAPTLEREGITLAPHATKVADFRDAEAATPVYMAEVERLILDLTGATKVLVMGGAVLRYSKRSAHFGTGVNSQPAGFIHVDYTELSAPDLVSRSAGDEMRPGRRMAGYNIWRVVSQPPQDMPLAVCDARTIADADLVRADAMFDVGEEPWWTFEAFLLRYNPAHRWLYYPDMRPDEALVFKSFETDPSQPVRVPHTAFENPLCPPDAPGRVSVEARAFAFFD